MDFAPFTGSYAFNFSSICPFSSANIAIQDSPSLLPNVKERTPFFQILPSSQSTSLYISFPFPTNFLERVTCICYVHFLNFLHSVHLDCTATTFWPKLPSLWTAMVSSQLEPNFRPQPVPAVRNPAAPPVALGPPCALAF